MQELTSRMQAALQASDPETMMKTWLPATIQNWEQMQRMFWAQMAGGMPQGPDKSRR